MSVVAEDVSRSWIPTWALAVALAGVLWWFLSQQSKKKLNLPPGPSGFPVVGSLLHLGEMSHEKFVEYSKTYGNVFSVKLGSFLGVVLSDSQTMKEVLQNTDKFASRPDLVTFRTFLKGNNVALANMSGPKMVEHRRFFLRALRDFGMGKPLMEEKILHHYGILSSRLADLNGKPTDPGPLFGATVCNIIVSVLSSRNYDLDDPTFKGFLKDMDEMMHLFGGTAILNFLPWLRHIPGMNKMLGLQQLRQLSEKMMTGFFEVMVEEHFKDFDPNNIRDIIDEYIRTMHAEDVKHFSVKNCVGMTGDFFVAGTETITTTMKYALIVLMQHPDVQTKMQKEIDDVVGRGRHVTMKDKPNLPYTEATISEFQRRGNITPFGLLHSNEKQATINGYDIPANSWIFPNIYQAMRDGNCWDEPLKFKPERFLTPEGKFKAISEADGFLPFGIGKRMCPGMLLAKTEEFLIFSNLLQNFSIKLPADEPMPSLDEELTNGVVLAPKKFRTCFVQR